jgi:hypothetical protein
MLAVVKCVIYLCMYAYFFKLLSALDSNDIGYSEEGEIFEYHDKDQGQAEKGKPSKLVASLNSCFTYCMIYSCLPKCMILCCYYS